MRTVLLLCGLLSLIGGSVFAQDAPADSTYTILKTLDEVAVTAERRQALMHRTKEGGVAVNLREMQNLPKFLGTADPVRYLQSIAGVQTNNETTAGIYIQGCDDHHTLLTVDGAPVYYPNHLLGLFSAFIPAQYETMRMTQSAHNASFANRLGGSVALDSYRDFDRKIGVEGNVGLISADLTLPAMIGDRSHLRLSARSSYLGLLYKSLLRVGNMNPGYDFQDFNLSYAYRPTGCDEVVLSGYYGMDRIDVDAPISQTDVDFGWSNLGTSLSWTHRGAAQWHTVAHFSGFTNALHVQEEPIRVRAGSDLASAGVRSDVDYALSDVLTVIAGAEYVHYWNDPMAFKAMGLGRDVVSVPPLFQADEAAVYGGIRHEPWPFIHYEAGVRASLYHSGGSLHWAADPRVTLNVSCTPEHRLQLHYGLYHQYLHKAGLTDGGLPTDYFFLATEEQRPAYAYSVALGYEGSVANGAYSFSAETYFKQLYRVTEATAGMFDLLGGTFDYASCLITGKGRNYGINLMAHKNAGIVRGYVSYTLGWAMRNFPDLAQGYAVRARHDRRHNLAVVLNAHFARRWTVGGMFVLASGLPYTPARQAYILNGRIVCEYGTHNSATMPLYHRLDLSADYRIIDQARQQLGINLSLYNVYAHNNIQFMVPDNKFRMKSIGFIATIIPSVSVYFRF